MRTPHTRHSDGAQHSDGEALGTVGGVTRYSLDSSTRRPAGSDVVIGGSPLRLFRLTPAGVGVYARIAAGEDVADDRLIERLLEAGAIHPRPATSPYTAADVTVIVPAFVFGETALSEIVRCCPGVATVIAVDDASDPPVSAVAGARVLRLRTNAGPAVARNAGLGAATTPLVAFVDTDVRLVPGWLDPLLLHFADDRVGLVAPRVASAPGAGAVAAYEQGHSPLDLGPEPGRIAPGTRLSYVPAAAILVRADALRAIDGFQRALRLRRGRRRGLAPRRGRVALPLRAGVRRPPPAAGLVARPHRPALLVRLVGRSPRPAPPRRPRPRPRQRMERCRVGLAGRRPAAPRRRRGRGHRRRPRAQAARRAGRRVAAPRRPRPPARRPLAGRRRPPRVVADPPRRGAGVPACASRRRPGHGPGAARRRRAQARRRPRLRRRRSGRASSPSASRARCCRPSPPGRGAPRATGRSPA